MANPAWSTLPLLNAAAQGDLQLVQQLLKGQHAIEVNAANKATGRTALHTAVAAAAVSVYGGHQPVVELLLQHGASVNTADEAGLTPLHTACSSGCVLLVHLLLEHGGCINSMDKAGQTPLHAAVSAAVSPEGGPYRGHLSVLRLLLDRGAHVNTADESGQTPLHTAAAGGSAPLVNLLLAHGADANRMDEAGQAPVHGAARFGHVEVARLLLAHDPTQATCRAQDGRTALHVAAQYGHWPVARLLLENGAQVDCQDQAGKTALHVATWAGQFWVVYYLLRAFGEPSELLCAQDQRGQTPLHAAALGGNGLVLQLLLKQGLPHLVHQQDKDGRTPLMCAACMDHASAVQLLLGGGADPDTVDKDCRTPLHWAAYLNHMAVAKVLADTNMEVVDKDGRTPVHAAACMGHVAMVQLLLERGANPDAMDKDGRTLLEAAAAGGNAQLLQVVRAHARPRSSCSSLSASSVSPSTTPASSSATGAPRHVPSVLVLPAASSRQLPSSSNRSVPSQTPTSFTAATGSSTLTPAAPVASAAAEAAAVTAAAAAAAAAAAPVAASAFIGCWPPGMAPPPPAGPNPYLVTPPAKASPSKPPKAPTPAHGITATAKGAAAAATGAQGTTGAGAGLPALPARPPMAQSAFVGFWPPGMEPPPVAMDAQSDAGSSLLTPWDGPSREISISMPSTCLEIEPEELPEGKLIGEGAFGVVSRCAWSGRQVAVKRFPGRSLSASVIRSFKTEVGTLSNLHHPNVVEFLGAVVKPPKLAIITEFVRRGSLYSLLHSSRGGVELDPQRRLSIAKDIARALLYLHSCRPAIVHRDLKSANILISGDWTAKVCDFGMSQMLREAFLSARSQLGTFAWAAPEAFGSTELNEKCDVYSFAVVLWELVTGQTPWAGLSFPQIAMTVAVHGQRLPLPEDVDPQLQALICDCWAAEPAARPGFDAILSRLAQLSEICPSRQKPPFEHTGRAALPAVLGLGNGLGAAKPQAYEAGKGSSSLNPLPAQPTGSATPEGLGSAGGRNCSSPHAQVPAGAPSQLPSRAQQAAGPATPPLVALPAGRASDAQAVYQRGFMGLVQLVCGQQQVCPQPGGCAAGRAGCASHTQDEETCQLQAGESSSEEASIATLGDEDGSSSSLDNDLHVGLVSGMVSGRMGTLSSEGEASGSSGPAGLRPSTGSRGGCMMEALGSPFASKSASLTPQLTPPKAFEICCVATAGGSNSSSSSGKTQQKSGAASRAPAGSSNSSSSSSSWWLRSCCCWPLPTVPATPPSGLWPREVATAPSLTAQTAAVPTAAPAARAPRLSAPAAVAKRLSLAAPPAVVRAPEPARMLPALPISRPPASQ